MLTSIWGSGNIMTNGKVKAPDCYRFFMQTQPQVRRYRALSKVCLQRQALEMCGVWSNGCKETTGERPRGEESRVQGLVRSQQRTGLGSFQGLEGREPREVQTVPKAIPCFRARETQIQRSTAKTAASLTSQPINSDRGVQIRVAGKTKEQMPRLWVRIYNRDSMQYPTMLGSRFAYITGGIRLEREYTSIMQIVQFIKTTENLPRVERIQPPSRLEF